MQPTQSPNQAPPPLQPPSGSDPYHFIFQPNNPGKKRLIPSTSSVKGKIIVFGAGLVIVIILISIITSVLASSGKAGTQDLVELTQRQQELIRISQIGVSKARSQDVRNFAVTTQSVLTSDQQLLIAQLKHSRIKVATSTLGLKKNARTDALLVQADQANQFDDVFTKTIKSELSDYQQAIKKARDANDVSSLRELFLAEDKNVLYLVGVAK